MIALIGGEIAKTGEKSSDCNIWWEDEMAPGLRKTQENNTDWKIGRMWGCLIPDTAGLKVPMLSQTVLTIAVAF
jgi:predicted molibdopterin-dependent oxidoreductase YjgC